MLPSELLDDLSGLPFLQRLAAEPPVGDARIQAKAWVQKHVVHANRAALAGGGSASSAGARLFEGGLWFAVDELDAAHAIFQDDPSPQGSYWHGMLHRREGDLFNARYWYQRAGRVRGLPRMADFSAEALLRLCEADAKGRAPTSDIEAALEMQRTEWECLMGAALKQAAEQS
jgi:hypothetical protein